MLPPVCSLSCIKIVFTVQLLCSSFYYLLHSCFPNCVSGDLWSSLLCPQDDGLLSGLRLCGGLGSFPTSHRLCGGLGSFHTSHRVCGGLGSFPTSHRVCGGLGSFPTSHRLCGGLGSLNTSHRLCGGLGSFPASPVWAVLWHERRQWELFVQLMTVGMQGCVFYMMN